MKMSCNGCRVLRKGCSDSCVLRPCLQWIRTAESQANATVFLAKFYGRAGLLNLISDGPEHLRPAIFRSLLYEACGRLVNPTYGSLGLLLSGDWKSCEAGVELILQGRSIYPAHFNLPNNNTDPGSKPDREQCDHSASTSLLVESVSRELQKVKSRGQFKPTTAHGMKRSGDFAAAEEDTMPCGSSKRRALMADAAQRNWHSNASSSESDRREDDDQYNSSESEIQMISTIRKPAEAAYHLCVDDVELELTLGSPRTPVDCKSYSGSAFHICTEDSPILTCPGLRMNGYIEHALNKPAAEP